MDTIFDLSKVKKLVEDKDAPAVIIVDTNIFMKLDTPPISEWKSSIKNPVYILPDIVMAEIVMNHNKKGEADEPKFAKDSIIPMLKQGDIQDGINIPDVGWFISVKSPSKSVIEHAMDQVPVIFTSVKQNDTLLLLLTKDCDEIINQNKVVFITNDSYLYLTGTTHVSPILFCEKFAIHELENWFAGRKNKTPKLDWEKELAIIQDNITNNSVKVEATLTDYKSAPQWLGHKSLIVAEGNGIVHDGNKNIPFHWTIPFYPQIVSAKLPQEDTPELPPLHLDFFGEDNFSQNLFDGIADKLLECSDISFEEGKPTLQNPESVMERLLFQEYIIREGGSEKALEELRQDIEQFEGLANHWAAWVLNKDRDAKGGDEQFECLQGLIEAVSECWKIGETYKFSFVPKT